MSGKSRTKEYIVWAQMIQRCCNPKHPKFHFYGGRGITVCTRWRGSFAYFLDDMGPRPTPKHSIERMNNAFGYAPDNCRWATYDEQNRNNSRNHFIEWRGERKCLTDWANEFSIPSGTFYSRLKHGWTIERALNMPRRHKAVNQNAKKAVQP